ncbi:MAG: hypothetical protein M3332_02190, partial [Actinomycetota bacterium]|nr:hypothetical protein [Actinomycetota bacterium]
YGIERAAYGSANVLGLACPLACLRGPVPLAARGLAAVLARAGPAGARGHRQTCAAGAAGAVE